jgi:hypothetical protein
MAEPNSPPDEASDYLLGRLAPAARRAFETRLAQDAGLRQLVCELEKGLLALALTAPQLAPPREAWTHIEAAVAGRPLAKIWRSFFQLKRLVNGWAVAGCLALALLIHIFWFHPPTRGPGSSALNSGENKTGGIVASARTPAPVPGPATRNPSGTPAVSVGQTSLTAVVQPHGGRTNLVLPDQNNLAAGVGPPVLKPQAGDEETAALNELKGILFDDAQADPNHARLSPRMQQAVLQAVALEMGATPDASTPVGGELVDFVEVPNSTFPVVTPTPTFTDSAAAPVDLAALPVDANSSLPMFAWDNNIFVPVDPSTLPAGSGPVTVWLVDGEGNQSILGIVYLGSNPTIININHANTSGSWHYYVTIGGTNILGQFPPRQ